MFEAVITATHLLKRSLSCRNLVEKHAGQREADEAIQLLFAAFAVDASVIAEAIKTGEPDFEDAVPFIAARQVSATHVVTRDPKGFARSSLIVLSPPQWVDLVNA